MSEAELERFRREWQEEVHARDRQGPRAQAARPSSAQVQPGGSQRGPRLPPAAQRRAPEDDKLPGGGWNFDNLGEGESTQRLGVSGEGAHPEALKAIEPKTALEFYERAVESETKGRLGESLAHYRQAFKLNDRVDQQYKNKHFPPSSFASQSKGSKSDSSNAAAPNPTTAPVRSEPEVRGQISSLVISFAGEQIQGSPPLIARDVPPPCPIASVPSEILREILRFSALADIASFGRLALVCKRLAYLVATEASIWKEVCLESRFGFESMHYEFACSLRGTPIESNVLSDFDDLSLTGEASNADQEAEPRSIEPSPLALSLLYPSYASMFHHRPRLRFAGVYISTVNYVRPGAPAPTQVTWNSPVHVVTYYRYLRFYRNGSCLSLLTTVEPLEVVPHFHAEHVRETPGVLAGPGLVAVAKYTLRGRWKMSHLHPASASAEGAQKQEEELEPEGNVLVETYGATPPLVYHMQLALRSNSGRGPKNTKLVWRGFWSYDKITDDWAEFGLRNDRAYVWSRVKSWGDA